MKVLSLIICGVFVAQSVQAQDRKVSVQVDLGRSYEWTNADSYTGSSVDHGALEAVIGYRIWQGRHVAVGIIGSAAGQESLKYPLICLIRPPSSECAPVFPSFDRVYALMPGLETRSGILRVAAGPALVQAGQNTVAAWSGRIDGFLPVVWRISLAGSARGFLINSYQGNSFTSRTLAFGLRYR